MPFLSLSLSPAKPASRPVSFSRGETTEAHEQPKPLFQGQGRGVELGRVEHKPSKLKTGGGGRGGEALPRILSTTPLHQILGYGGGYEGERQREGMISSTKKRSRAVISFRRSNRICSSPLSNSPIYQQAIYTYIEIEQD